MSTPLTAEQKLTETLARHRAEISALTARIEDERRDGHAALLDRLNKDAAQAITATIERTREIITLDRTRGDLAVIPAGVPVALSAEMAQVVADAEAQGRRRPGVLIFTGRADRFGHQPATAYALVDVSHEVWG